MKKYDGTIMDLFELRISDYIMNEVTVNTSKEICDSIEFNVIDAYRDLVRFPDPCPNCTRSGTDHDGECETPNWKGKDYGVFKKI